MNHVSICLLLGGLLLPVTCLAQLKLVADPSGATQYRVPVGWKVNTSTENGLYVWNAVEDPDRPDSPGLVVLALPAQPGVDEQFALSAIAAEIPQFAVNDQRVVSADDQHFLATGMIEGQKAEVAVVYRRDPSQGLVFVGCLAAPAKRYASLGKEQLLYDALGLPNPFATGGGGPALSGNLNMQDPAVKSAILAGSSAPAPQALVGRWVQAVGMSTGDAYQNLSSGAVRQGFSGHGHLLELQADGQYRLTYSYQGFLQGCDNEASIVEQGRYSLSDRQLSLHPSGYKGHFKVCGALTPQQVKNPPTRTFQIGMDAAGKYLVIQGTPFEYSISTELATDGSSYIPEGFEKVR